MQGTRHKWIVPILIISFTLYNIGIPLFVHFCASQNTLQTHLIPQKHDCNKKLNHNVEKTCCNKNKKNNPSKEHINPKTQTQNNCYGEYFTPSDCCKLTYHIKKNHKECLQELPKTLKKNFSCTTRPSDYYIAAAPLPKCKYNKKTCSSSKWDIYPIEYFPLRL